MTQQESNWTEVDLWAEIHRLRAAVKGPEGYASWQDAAIAERVRRLKAETPLTEEEAREIAFRAAKAFSPPYFNGNDFQPELWVVHACISASTPGQREAAKGRDRWSRGNAIREHGTPDRE